MPQATLNPTSHFGDSYASQSKVKLRLGTWQLVGFSLSAINSGEFGASAVGVVFTDIVSFEHLLGGGKLIDFVNAKFLRISSANVANSFIGDISGLKIMTPGSNFISKSKV